MTKTWFKNYPENVAHQIELDNRRSLVDLFNQAIVNYQDITAFSNEGTSLSYSDVDRLSRDFAAYLQTSLSVKKGDRIALMCPNTLSFPIAMWGIIRAGAVQVNVNPSYTSRELKHQLDNAQVNTIVIFSSSTTVLSEIIADVVIDNIIIINPDDLMNHSTNLPNIDKRLTNTLSFVEVLNQGHQLPFTEPVLDANDLLFLQYTGGTTGLSKGAKLSHGNIVANILQYKEFAKEHIDIGKEVVLTVLPMYHIFALTVNVLCYFVFGAKNILVTDPKNVAHLLAIWKTEKITFFSGVNTLFNSLLGAPSFSHSNFTALKLTVGGGAAIQEVVSSKWLQITGCRLLEGYGLSETSPILTLNFGTKNRYINGIGTPIPSTDISIRDENGNEVSAGNSGELCAKGPQVMAGYWQDLRATSECMTPDGYFKTGDIALLDEHGIFHIVDRKKDMIIVSGFNVYPNEIENEVAKIKGVTELACIGVADEKTGEAVKLFVVRNNNELTEDHIIDFCRQQLVAYKVPKDITFVEQLPKSSVGKILRRALK